LPRQNLMTQSIFEPPIYQPAAKKCSPVVATCLECNTSAMQTITISILTAYVRKYSTKLYFVYCRQNQVSKLLHLSTLSTKPITTSTVLSCKQEWN
jgi:hypothetical protein